MYVKMRALVKGVANREWQGKSYHSIEVFGGGGVEGQPTDISIGVDMTTQKAMFEQADKIKPATVDFVVDLSIWDRKPRFNLVSMQAGVVK